MSPTENNDERMCVTNGGPGCECRKSTSFGCWGPRAIHICCPCSTCIIDQVVNILYVRRLAQIRTAFLLHFFVRRYGYQTSEIFDNDGTMGKGDWGSRKNRYIYLQHRTSTQVKAAAEVGAFFYAWNVLTCTLEAARL